MIVRILLGGAHSKSMRLSFGNKITDNVQKNLSHRLIDITVEAKGDSWIEDHNADIMVKAYDENNAMIGLKYPKNV